MTASRRDPLVWITISSEDYSVYHIIRFCPRKRFIEAHNLKRIRLSRALRQERELCDDCSSILAGLDDIMDRLDRRRE